MIFIALDKWRKKPTKEMLDQAKKDFEQMAQEGIKVIGMYWTLGRYDMVSVLEAKDEKTMMKAAIKAGDRLSQEHLVAVSREEAIKLVE